MATARPAFFTIPAVIITAVIVLTLWLLVGYEPIWGSNPYAASYEARIELYRSKLDSLNKIRGIRDRIFMRQMANLFIAEYIAEKIRPTDVLLLPPRQYANKYMDMEAIWTDPRILTWLVGFQNVVAWSDTARRKEVNAYVVLEPGSIWLTRPGGQTNIDSLLRVFEGSR